MLALCKSTQVRVLFILEASKKKAAPFTRGFFSCREGLITCKFSIRFVLILSRSIFWFTFVACCGRLQTKCTNQNDSIAGSRMMAALKIMS